MLLIEKKRDISEPRMFLCVSWFNLGLIGTKRASTTHISTETHGHDCKIYVYK